MHYKKNGLTWRPQVITKMVNFVIFNYMWRIFGITGGVTYSKSQKVLCDEFLSHHILLLYVQSLRIHIAYMPVEVLLKLIRLTLDTTIPWLLKGGPSPFNLFIDKILNRQKLLKERNKKIFKKLKLQKRWKMCCFWICFRKGN